MSDDTTGTVGDGDGAGHADDVMAYAPLLALDALDEVDRARVLRAVARASAAEQAAFEAEVAAVRESMVDLSHTTATAPRPEIRARLLELVGDGGVDGGRQVDAGTDPAATGGTWTDKTVTQPAGTQPAGTPPNGTQPTAPETTVTDIGERPVRQRRTGFTRMRMVAAAAAAAVVVGLGGAAVGYTVAHRTGSAPESKTEQIFAAPDVRTTSGVLAGGRATVTYSPSSGDGVLVMNDVPSPAPGTVYQMWLVGPTGPKLAGTMSEADMAPSITEVITGMHGATAVAFTVGDSSAPDKMISAPVAQLPLS